MSNLNQSVVKKNHLNHVLKDGRRVKYGQWLGGLFAGSYDRIMARRIFPKLFGADQVCHEIILKCAYRDYHGLEVLELGTGSGNASALLAKENRYSGVDVSRQLLKRAYAAFRQAGFAEAALYVCSAENLPFKGNSFDLAICNLSLNFFPNIKQALSEAHRVLKSDGELIVSVPLADCLPEGSCIRGHQFTKEALNGLLQEVGFCSMEEFDRNGALLYFRCENGDRGPDHGVDVKIGTRDRGL